jgi:hypothetical protein
MARSLKTRRGGRSTDSGERIEVPEDRDSQRRSGNAPARRRRAKVGKRDNPSYTQISALVMKDVKAQVDLARVQASVTTGRKIEFGEIVNMLLAHYAIDGVSLEELEESLREFQDR